MGRKNRNARARHAIELHGDIILSCPIETDIAVTPEHDSPNVLGAAFMYYYVVVTAVLTMTSMAGINNFA